MKLLLNRGLCVLLMRTQVQFGKSCLWTEVPVQHEANAASSNSGTQQSVSITYFFVTSIEMISARLTHFPHFLQHFSAVLFLNTSPNPTPPPSQQQPFLHIRHFYKIPIFLITHYILIIDYHWPSWINTIIRIFYAIFCQFPFIYNYLIYD